MTTHELAHKLLEGPDLLVTRNGYEGGVHEITTIQEPKKIKLNVHDEWYYGPHEYPYIDDIQEDIEYKLAIHIS